MSAEHDQEMTEAEEASLLEEEDDEEQAPGSSKEEVKEGSKDEKYQCRYFKEGTCKRGKLCMFQHPGGEDEEPKICKDFHFRGCARKLCKFMHLTEPEETKFRATGKLPRHKGDPETVAKLAHRFPGPMGPPGPYMMGPPPPIPPGDGRPPCKDFVKGTCSRGPKCKFAHISHRELELEARLRDMHHHMMMAGPRGPPGPGGKRKRAEDAGAPPGPDPEKVKMQKKITELQKQVVTLRKELDHFYEEQQHYMAAGPQAGYMGGPQGGYMGGPQGGYGQGGYGYNGYGGGW